MKKENVILDKSFKFAIRIVNLYRYLSNRKKEYIISKQMLKSGTSIGANINEAQAAQSRADFVSKMSIASKEARETKYWLKLLIETNYLDSNNKNVISLINEIDEIAKLLTSIVKNSKGKKDE